MRKQKQQDVDRHQKEKKERHNRDMQKERHEGITDDTHIIDREKRDNGKQDKAV